MLTALQRVGKSQPGVLAELLEQFIAWSARGGVLPLFVGSLRSVEIEAHYRANDANLPSRTDTLSFAADLYDEILEDLSVPGQKYLRGDLEHEGITREQAIAQAEAKPGPKAAGTRKARPGGVTPPAAGRVPSGRRQAQ